MPGWFDTETKYIMNTKKAEDKAKEEKEKEKEKAEEYIENSDEGVANAKSGQKLKRKDGTVVELSEGDITAAKNKLSDANANTDAETETETDTETDTDTDTDTDNEIEQVASAPETETILTNAKQKASEEGASEMVPEDTVQEIQEYVSNFGIKVDEDGNIHVPYDVSKLSTTFGVLTIVSGVLATVTGNILPVVDFTSFARSGQFGTKAAEAVNAMDNYCKLAQQHGINLVLDKQVQGDVKASETAEGISEEGTSKLARMNAAKQGNTAVVQTEVQGDLNKQLAEINNKYGIDLQKLIGEQTLQQINANTNAQTIMLTLAQQLKNTAQAEQLKAYANVIEQMSDDDLARVAKGIKSEKGITNFDNAMKAVDTALEGVGVVVNAIK